MLKAEVPDEHLVDVAEVHAGVVHREQARVAGQLDLRDVVVHVEADLTDAGDGDSVELHGRNR